MSTLRIVEKTKEEHCLFLLSSPKIILNHAKYIRQKSLICKSPILQKPRNSLTLEQSSS